MKPEVLVINITPESFAFKGKLSIEVKIYFLTV